jgi:hypothetical protein
VLIGGVVGVLIAAISMHNLVVYAISWTLASITFKVAPTLRHAEISMLVMCLVAFAGVVVPIVRSRIMPIVSSLREE